MGVRDRNIDWQRKSEFIDAGRFAQAAATTTLVSMDTGGMVMTEMSTFGFGGLLVGATGDKATALDFKVAREADPAHEIGVRVLWAPNAAVSTSDVILFSVHRDQFDVGEPIVTAATVLDTVIAAQSPTATTAYALHRTSRGVINADTFDYTMRQGGFLFEVNVGTFTGFEVTDVLFLGLEIDYMPLLCENSNETIGARNSDLVAG